MGDPPFLDLPLNGEIDDFRIVKGKAEWCWNFTAPGTAHTCNEPTSCDPSGVVEGCMSSWADNYNASANIDNGSCAKAGCTDETANNYDPLATTDDGSCSTGGGAANPSSEDSGGTTSGTYAISSGGTDYYYWHLEDISKRAVGLTAPQTHDDYHAWNYLYDGEEVDLYVIDSGVNSLHPMLQAHTGGTRVQSVPGYAGLDNGSKLFNEYKGFAFPLILFLNNENQNKV